MPITLVYVVAAIIPIIEAYIAAILSQVPRSIFGNHALTNSYRF